VCGRQASVPSSQSELAEDSDTCCTVALHARPTHDVTGVDAADHVVKQHLISADEQLPRFEPEIPRQFGVAADAVVPCTSDAVQQEAACRVVKYLSPLEL